MSPNQIDSSPSPLSQKVKHTSIRLNFQGIFGVTSDIVKQAFGWTYKASLEIHPTLGNKSSAKLLRHLMSYIWCEETNFWSNFHDIFGEKKNSEKETPSIELPRHLQNKITQMLKEKHQISWKSHPTMRNWYPKSCLQHLQITNQVQYSCIQDIILKMGAWPFQKNWVEVNDRCSLMHLPFENFG